MEEDKMSKNLLNVMALFVISLLAVSMAVNASVDTSLDIADVEVNGQGADIYTREQVDASNVDNLDGVAVDEGEVLEVKVDLEASGDLENIQIEIELYGYEYDDYENLEDETRVFNMEVSGEGTTSRTKTLEIQLPNRLDKDRYLLKVSVDAKDITSLVRYVVLQVEPARHGIQIADVAFSPGSSVKAGRSLLSIVLLENYGDKTEKDVKVSVAIPALGVSATEFVDVIETDNHNVDYEDVPEMFLQIPATAAAGQYDVVVTVKYDDLRETVTKTYTLNVVANEMFQTGEDKLVLAVGPESQSVAVGQTAIYGIALTNAGATSKAYILEAVTGGDWATATISESLVVLEPGKNKVVYIQVTPTAGAVAGEHLVSLTVKSSDEVLQTIALKADVVAGSAAAGSGVSLRNGLEIALIVLVVLLVIIGLIVGFSRLKKDRNEDEEQTYY